jgi:hypothetical protein
MDPRLRDCIDQMRILADQPASETNRLPLGERYVDEYLRVRGASPERLIHEINAKGEDPFWITMREYVQSRMRRSDD